MKRLLLMLLALSLGPVVMAAELRNPSFEDADPDADNVFEDRAEGWGRWGHWMNRETVWKPVRTGKAIIGYHHWEIPSDENSGFYQDVEGITAGKTITFTIYASKDAKLNAEKVELRLEPLNGGDPISSAEFLDKDIKTGWTQLSVDGVVEGEGVRVLVICYPKQGSGRDGALRFDDAEIKEE